eukprot:2279249-Rhodomonas_salina.1
MRCASRAVEARPRQDACAEAKPLWRGLHPAPAVNDRESTVLESAFNGLGRFQRSRQWAMRGQKAGGMRQGHEVGGRT